jgi:hypothetical protein
LLPDPAGHSRNLSLSLSRALSQYSHFDCLQVKVSLAFVYQPIRKSGFGVVSFPQFFAGRWS